MEACSFCGGRASTTVSDDSDVFRCCVDCDFAWAANPGLPDDTRVPVRWVDWSPSGMADRLDSIGNLEMDDADDLSRISKFLRSLP